MSQTGASFPRLHRRARSRRGNCAGPVAVYSCSRIGRVANPPSFSFTDWFRVRPSALSAVSAA